MTTRDSKSSSEVIDARAQALLDKWRVQADECERRKQENADAHHQPGEDINRAKMLTLRDCADDLAALLASPVPAPPEKDREDSLGLSIDMLDADRVREWARLLLVHGADISHWASVPHVASKLQILATNLEQAVRDIGKLRTLATPDPQGGEAEELRDEVNRLKAALFDVRRHLTQPFRDTDGAAKSYVKAILVIEDALFPKAEAPVSREQEKEHSAGCLSRHSPTGKCTCGDRKELSRE